MIAMCCKGAAAAYLEASNKETGAEFTLGQS